MACLSLLLCFLCVFARFRAGKAFSRLTMSSEETNERKGERSVSPRLFSYLLLIVFVRFVQRRLSIPSRTPCKRRGLFGSTSEPRETRPHSLSFSPALLARKEMSSELLIPFTRQALSYMYHYAHSFATGTSSKASRSSQLSRLWRSSGEFTFT